MSHRDRLTQHSNKQNKHLRQRQFDHLSHWPANIEGFDNIVRIMLEHRHNEILTKQLFSVKSLIHTFEFYLDLAES